MRSAAALAAALSLFAAAWARADDAGPSPGAVPLQTRPPIYSSRAPTLRRPSAHDFDFDRTTPSEITGRTYRGADTWLGDSGPGLAEQLRFELLTRGHAPASNGSAFDLDSKIADLSRLPDPFLSLGGRENAEDTYDLGHGLSIGLDLDDDDLAPTPLLPQLASVTGRLGYDLLPASPMRAKLFVGCGATWIDLENTQTVVNRLQERAGVILTSGLSVSF